MNKVFQYLNEIFILLGKDRRKLPSLVLLFIFSSFFDLAGLGLIAPYIKLVINPGKIEIGFLENLFINHGINYDWESLIFIFGLGLVFIFLFKAIGNLWIQYKITSFSQNQEIRLRTYLMEAYQKMPYQDYLRRNSSEYVHSIQILVPSYGSVLSLLLKTTSDLLIACAIIIVLAWQNILILSVLIILLGGVIFVYDRSFRVRLNEYGIHNNEANHKIVQSLHEAIEGLKELRILGKGLYFYKRLEEGAKSIAYFAVRQQILNLAPGYLLEFLLVGFVVTILSAIVFFGGSLIEIIPTMGVFGIAALRLKPTSNSLASSLVKLRFQRDSIRRLVEDVRSIESLNSKKNTIINTEKSSSQFKELVLSKASFCYPDMSMPALNNVSLRIQSGQTIGLMGPSGCGKTTLVDVMLGLLEPQSGTLRFNGRYLKEVLNEWRSQVAYLPQQVFLTDNTLKCNVAIGEEERDIDEDRLMEALHQARLTELLKQLPQGVNTLLGERGVRLSGGQRQRVALCRAFYHQRSVLILDEATSALDVETERVVLEEIKHLKGQKTMIVVAHRHSTVQHCDKIYNLEHGRIIDLGTPDQIFN